MNDIEFHVLGVAGKHLPDFSGRRHLVVSPFLVYLPASRSWLPASTSSWCLARNNSNFSRRRRYETWTAGGSLPSTWITTTPQCRHSANCTPRSSSSSERRCRPFLHRFGQCDRCERSAATSRSSLNSPGGPQLSVSTPVLSDLGKVLEPCEITGDHEPSEADELRKALDDLMRDAALGCSKSERLRKAAGPGILTSRVPNPFSLPVSSAEELLSCSPVLGSPCGVPISALASAITSRTYRLQISHPFSFYVSNSKDRRNRSAPQRSCGLYSSTTPPVDSTQ